MCVYARVCIVKKGKNVFLIKSHVKCVDNDFMSYQLTNV